MLKVATKTNSDFTLHDIPYPTSFEKITNGYDDTVDTILGYKQHTQKAYRGMSLQATWKLPTKEAARLQNIFENLSDTLVFESPLSSYASVPNAARDPEFILRSLFQNYMDSNSTIFKTHNGHNDRAEVYFGKGFTSLPSDYTLKSPTFHTIVRKGVSYLNSGLGEALDSLNKLNLDISIHIYSNNTYLDTYSSNAEYSVGVTLDNIYTDFPNADTLVLAYNYTKSVSDLDESSNTIGVVIPVAINSTEDEDFSFVDTISTTYRVVGSTSNNYISTFGDGMSEISYTFEEVLD